MKLGPAILGAVLVLTATLSAPASLQAAAPPAPQEAIAEFVDHMAATYQFSKPELVRLFELAKVQPGIIAAMERPAESKPWHQYRPIFLNRSRIRLGVRFWAAHADILAHAEEVYGVAPEIIVAIIGVETRYGKRSGNHRVMDALTTLAFHYPPRSSFFRSELEQYLLLTRDEQVDPLSLTGSYAGAMGQPQFIPSSFRRYAVDFDGDGKRDIWNNTTDAIGSVANYLKLHGWQHGKPVTVRARVSGDKYQTVLAQGLKPRLPVKRLKEFGIEALEDVGGKQAGALIELETESAPEYWIALQNFYVITRYNHSPLYAMAVYQLGQEILALRDPDIAQR